MTMKTGVRSQESGFREQGDHLLISSPLHPFTAAPHPGPLPEGEGEVFGDINGLTLAGFVNPADLEYQEPIEQIDFHFGVSRRTFVQVLGAGLMIAVCDFPQSAEAQQAQAAGGAAAADAADSSAPGRLSWPRDCISAKTER